MENISLRFFAEKTKHKHNYSFVLGLGIIYRDYTNFREAVIHVKSWVRKHKQVSIARDQVVVAAWSFLRHKTQWTELRKRTEVEQRWKVKVKTQNTQSCHSFSDADCVVLPFGILIARKEPVKGRNGSVLCHWPRRRKIGAAFHF